jgi:hypothetical protein
MILRYLSFYLMNLNHLLPLYLTFQKNRLFLSYDFLRLNQLYL